MARDSASDPSDAAEGRFYNRERELREVEAVWAAQGAQLVTLWGRRRVGKSTLLSRFLAGKRGVYLYGTRMALASRSGFTAALRRRADESGVLLLTPADLFA